MTIYQQNLLNIQEMEKRYNNKSVKLGSYAPGNKVWLNGNYIKIKHNQKLETKFLGLFQVL